MKKMALILATVGSLFTANVMAATTHTQKNHASKVSHKYKKPVLKKKVSQKAKLQKKIHH